MPIAELSPLTQVLSVKTLHKVYVMSDLKLTFSITSTAKNANSILLRLPQELKTHIYELALGDQLIHMVWNEPDKISHHLCQAKISEKGAYEIFATSSEPWFAEQIRNRHNACCDVKALNRKCFGCPEQSNITTEPQVTLSLALLRCCRQVYQETLVIIFSTNTWSFTQSWELGSFLYVCLNTRSLIETSFAIRRLHLDLIIRIDGDQKYWNQVFREIVEHLKFLQHFYVDIEHRPMENATLKLLEFKEPGRNPFLKDLLKLKMLPLKTVTVTVCDHHILHSMFASTTERVKDVRWTMAQKQEWAGYVRRVLLRQEDQEPASEEAT